MRLLCLIILVVNFFVLVNSQIEGLYCGTETCYDVLGVSRDDEKASIMKTYRKLAKMFHPDRQRTDEDRAAAEIKFRKIATAYEILRDDEQRKEYDYMLDNPEEMYYNYYQYYRRRYSTKVDVRIVLCIIITLISAAQYYGQWSSYNESIKYLVREPKYRIKAMEIAKSEGLLNNSTKKRENGRRKTKEEIKSVEEETIKKIIIEKMDINPTGNKRCGYTKPTIFKILWLQMAIFPYWVLRWFVSCLRWVFLYWILRREYSKDDKLVIIKKYMNLPEKQWEGLDEWEKEYYLKNELWKKKEFEIYRKKKDEEAKEKLASDPSYKRFRRFLKKGGPGQITFGQEDVDMNY